jgi:hypothetical protein
MLVGVVAFRKRRRRPWQDVRKTVDHQCNKTALHFTAWHQFTSLLLALQTLGEPSQIVIDM